MEEKGSFFQAFYESVEVLKDNLPSFLGLLFIGTVMNTYSIVYSGVVDDTTRIGMSILEVVVNIFLSVFALNIYFSKINKLDFNLRKTLWDLPTYIYYELAFGLAVLVGAVLLVIPALIIFYFFSLVPLVSILFDFKDEGVFKRTKSLIARNHKTYAVIVVVNIFLIMMSQGLAGIIGLLGNGVVITVGLSFFVSLFSLLAFGISVSHLSRLCQTEISELFHQS